MIAANFYNDFAKRSNSTLRPQGDGVVVNLSFKDSVDITRPVFTWQGSVPDMIMHVTYLKIKKDYIRTAVDFYYFVDRVDFINLHTWEITCALDYLATYKDHILLNSAFIELAANGYNPYIADGRYAALSTYQTKMSPLETKFNLTATTAIVLTPASEGNSIGGMCTVSAFDPPVLSGVRQKLNDLYNVTQTPESLDDVVSQIKRIYNSPFDAFVGAYLLPVPKSVLSSGGADVIKLGDYYIGTGSSVTALIAQVCDGSIAVSHRYGDFRDNTFTDYFLSLPFVGTVTLPSDIMSTAQSVRIVGTMDILGNVTYKVMVGQSVIGVYGGSCVISLPLAQSAVGNPIKQATAGADTILSGVTALSGALMMPFNPLAGIGTMVSGLSSAFKSTVDTAIAGKETTVMTKGSAGGAVSGILSTFVELAIISRDTATSGISPVIGRPVMSAGKIGDRTGYIKTRGASVTVPAYETVRECINMALDGGVYIE